MIEVIDDILLLEDAVVMDTPLIDIRVRCITDTMCVTIYNGFIG